VFARVHRYTARPGLVEVHAQTFETALTRHYEALPGFRGALLLADRATGEMIALTLWASEEAFDATIEQAAAEAMRGAALGGVDAVPDPRRFEVVARIR
jgi:heme-degrading monooxygenase HmoA